MAVVTSFWIISLLGCIISRFSVHGACTEPLGVANAYITSTSPYNTNDRVYFRCYDGFTMSGTPSLLCLSSGSWSGTYPTCASNDEAVTIKQTVTSPQDDGNSGWMMLAFGSFIGLILLLLIVFALIFFYFMYRRQRDQSHALQRRIAQLTGRDSVRESKWFPPPVSPSQVDEP